MNEEKALLGALERAHRRANAIWLRRLNVQRGSVAPTRFTLAERAERLAVALRAAEEREEALQDDISDLRRGKWL